MRGIAASWVLTGDAEQAPIERGAVVLDADECIVAVGPAEQLRASHPGARWSQLDAVLLPGLVNAHTHLELSSMRGQVPGGRGFVPWLRGLVEARGRLSPELDAEAIDAAVSELLRFGTAAVGEVTNSLAAVPHLASAPLQARVFHEVFGTRRAAGEAMLSGSAAQRAAIEPWPENVSYALSPHTPFTMHPEVLGQVVARARAFAALTSLHLCEHPAERAFLQDHGGPFAAFLAEYGSQADWPAPGLDPVRYVERLGVLSPDVLCVHLADAREDEIALVARAGAPVVLCPRSNLHISLKLPPLRALLEAGIEPALGTDSLASNTSLDVLQEARALAQRFPSVPARRLLAMATSYGAKALRLGQLGRLAVGMTPGVIAFEHAVQAPSDPERFVLSAAAAVRHVLARPARCIAQNSSSA